jgi:hypothetical protein
LDETSVLFISYPENVGTLGGLDYDADFDANVEPFFVAGEGAFNVYLYTSLPPRIVAAHTAGYAVHQQCKASRDRMQKIQ